MDKTHGGTARLATESVVGWADLSAPCVKDGEIIGRGQNRVLLTGYESITPKYRDHDASSRPKS